MSAAPEVPSDELEEERRTPNGSSSLMLLGLPRPRNSVSYSGCTLPQKSVNSIVSKNASTSTILPARIRMYQV